MRRLAGCAACDRVCASGLRQRAHRAASRAAPHRRFAEGSTIPFQPIHSLFRFERSPSARPRLAARGSRGFMARPPYTGYRHPRNPTGRLTEREFATVSRADRPYSYAYPTTWAMTILGLTELRSRGTDDLMATMRNPLLRSCRRLACLTRRFRSGASVPGSGKRGSGHARLQRWPPH